MKCRNYLKSPVSVITAFLCSQLLFFSVKDVLYSYEYAKIRGAFNKFPDFFKQAFKIVIDS